MAKAHKKSTATPSKAERRRQAVPDDQSLYKHPDLPSLAQQERRQDMLSRLHEVQEQKRIWMFVVGICFGMNLLLLGLGLWGWLNK